MTYMKLAAKYRTSAAGRAAVPETDLIPAPVISNFEMWTKVVRLLPTTNTRLHTTDFERSDRVT